MSNAVRAMTLEDVPSAPPDRLSVTVDTLTSITIQWRPPLEDKKNGVIKGYKVRRRKIWQWNRGLCCRCCGLRYMSSLSLRTHDESMMPFTHELESRITIVGCCVLRRCCCECTCRDVKTWHNAIHLSNLLQVFSNTGYSQAALESRFCKPHDQ